MCDPIKKQIGDLLPAETIKMLDHMADAVTTCYVHGLIGDAASDMARKRLMKKIHVALEVERDEREDIQAERKLEAHNAARVTRQ